MSHLPPRCAGRCRTEIWLSEKVSRYTGASQLQLRVSRYTVQLRFHFSCWNSKIFGAILFCRGATLTRCISLPRCGFRLQVEASCLQLELLRLQLCLYFQLELFYLQLELLCLQWEVCLKSSNCKCKSFPPFSERVSNAALANAALVLSSNRWKKMFVMGSSVENKSKKTWASIFTLSPCGNRCRFSESEIFFSQVTNPPIENRIEQKIFKH